MARRGGYHHWHMQFPESDAQPVSKGTAKRVIRAFRPYKRQVSIVATLIVITSAMGVVNPLLIRTLVAMLWLSWQLTVLSLFLTPVFVWITRRVGKARQEVAARTQQSLAEISAISQETLSVSGILLTKAFGRQPYEIGRFEKENERLAGLEIRQSMVGRYFFAIVQIFFSITPALVYLVAGLVIAHEPVSAITIQAGTIVAFTTLQSRLFFPIGQMLQVSVEVQSSMALFHRIFEYLDMPLDIVDAPDARALPKESLRGEVAFRHVFFRYDTGPETSSNGDGFGGALEVTTPESLMLAATLPDVNERPRPWTLEDVNIEIEAGRLAALVGPSGAGKTTMTYLVPPM